MQSIQLSKKILANLFSIFEDFKSYKDWTRPGHLRTSVHPRYLRTEMKMLVWIYFHLWKVDVATDTQGDPDDVLDFGN